MAQLVLAKKPTVLMTNSRSIGHELKKPCDGGHEHQPLLDGRANGAARYPPALCRAICRGVAKENMQRQLVISAVMVVGKGVHGITIDSEGYHENHDAEIERLMCEEFGKEECPAEIASGLGGCSTAPPRP